jgi:hypothetical protein
VLTRIALRSGRCVIFPFDTPLAASDRFALLGGEFINGTPMTISNNFV